MERTFFYNRYIDDFKVGMLVEYKGKQHRVEKNTGERVYFGKTHKNWLDLKDVGLAID